MKRWLEIIICLLIVPACATLDIPPIEEDVYHNTVTAWVEWDERNAETSRILAQQFLTNWDLNRPIMLVLINEDELPWNVKKAIDGLDTLASWHQLQMATDPNYRIDNETAGDTLQAVLVLGREVVDQGVENSITTLLRLIAILAR
jgi:hypothetical protein